MINTKAIVRDFHKLRTGNKTRYVKVERKNDPSAEYNACVANAMNTGDPIVYGWMMIYAKNDVRVEFVPHAWNVKAGKHYDVTPIRNEHLISERHYIVDFDLDFKQVGGKFYHILVALNNFKWADNYFYDGYWYEVQMSEIKHLDDGSISQDIEWAKGPLVEFKYLPYQGEKYVEDDEGNMYNACNLNLKEMETA